MCETENSNYEGTQGTSKEIGIVVNIAKLCHEVNRAYCQAIGDISQVTWDDAPDWQKDSAINGVKFHLDNPNSMPEDSHKNWLAQKAVEGWKFGAIKDVEKKEHPCFMPFQYLPANQRVKDYIFTAIVKNYK